MTYEMLREGKVIDLLKRLSEDIKIHPTRIRLIDHGTVVTRFNSSLSEYILAEATWKHFHITERRNTSTIAYDFPEIYQQAIEEVGPESENVDRRLLAIYEEVVAKAMNCP